MGNHARLRSLDLFRGIALAGMLMVNNQGDWGRVYASVRHAAWHGLTAADLVFPFFLFAMGMAIPLALRETPGGISAPRVLKIFRRAALIFMLGMALHALSASSLAQLRIPGVLQRIAICYLAASLFCIKFSFKARWAIFGGALALYGALLLFVPVPGYGAGELDPLGNICRRVDMLLLAGHTYKSSLSPGMDPEGILSTLGALGTTMLGVSAEGIVSAGADARAAAKKLLVTGALIGLAGLALTPVLPLNKQLWTPSFALVTGGLAFVLLAPLHLFTNTERARFWETPLLSFGMNPLAAYILSTAFGTLSVKIMIGGEHGAVLSLKAIAYNALFASWMEAYAASFAYSVCFMCAWAGVMYLLYRKKYFLKV